MLKLGYLPLIIAVVDIIMYIVCSKHLGKTMKPRATMYVLFVAFFTIYALRGSVIDVLREFVVT